jgi:hypothetical protein
MELQELSHDDSSGCHVSPRNKDLWIAAAAVFTNPRAELRELKSVVVR